MFKRSFEFKIISPLSCVIDNVDRGFFWGGLRENKSLDTSITAPFFFDMSFNMENISSTCTFLSDDLF